MKLNYGEEHQHTQSTTHLQCVLTSAALLKKGALRFSVCNKSLSIYLLLPISSLSAEHNKKANQIRLVIKQRPISGPLFDMDQH